MDPRERVVDPEEHLRMALDGAQAGLWTALPGIISSFDAVRMTAEVRPAIKGRVQDASGRLTDVEINLLLDCPVLFPSGGGYTLTFPVRPGDECLVVFGSRCIDGWWQQGGVQQQVEFRMHDLSDGFVLVGPRSRPRALAPAVSADTVQLRSDDGALYIELAGGHIVNILAPGGLNIEAAGGVRITGPTTFSGTVVANGHVIDERHAHINVARGGAISGPVE
jgi:hypothetical protein